MDTEIIKGNHAVDYYLINGKGQVTFSEIFSLNVIGVTVSDENQREQYLNNLKKVRGHPNVVRIESFDSKRNMIILEEINTTLLELVHERPGTDFCEYVEVLNKYRMTPFLQDIIKGIIRGIFYLDEMEIHVGISINNVVFGSGDPHHKNPKIKDLTDFTGNFNLLKMLEGLEFLIRQILAEHNIGSNVTENVKHFLNKLKTPLNHINVGYWENHPALKKNGENLNYIRDLRDGCRKKKLRGLKQAEKFRRSVFKNWTSQVRVYKHLDGMMIYESKTFNKHYCNTLIELVYYIRNAKEHLNEEVYRCQAREASNTLTHSKDVQYSPLLNGNTDYTDLKIELIFEILFPTLVTYLYDYIVLLP